MSESSFNAGMDDAAMGEPPKTYADADYLQAYNYFSVQHHPEPQEPEPSVCEQYGHFYIGIPFEDKTKELIDLCQICGLSRIEIETPVIQTSCGTEAPF